MLTQATPAFNVVPLMATSSEFLRDFCVRHLRLANALQKRFGKIRVATTVLAEAE